MRNVRRFIACMLSTIALALLPNASLGKGEDLNPVKFIAPPKHDALVIADKTRKATVVVTKSAGAGLNYAVNDLVDSVKAATGVTLDIAKDGKIPAEGVVIILGDHPDAEAAGLVGSKMPVEGFTVLTAANRVYIVGNDEDIAGVQNVRSNGTAWGVYDFCERFIDVRWYWPDARGERVGVSVPMRESIAVPPTHYTDAPVFRKREIWPSGGPRVAHADVGLHHHRMRSADTWPVRLRVHAPHDWSQLYRTSRLEIFQLRSDGDRDYSMLCYGHPKTLETYLEQIDAQLKPAAKTPGGATVVDDKNITVSPNDMAVACTCEYCKKLWDNDGGLYGTASPVLTRFVAQLSREVKQRWPDMTIVYLPYKNYTFVPRTITDDMKFAGNVEVQICGMPGLAQYKEPAINQSEQANIDAWMKLSGRKIQNWHYSCWPEDRTSAVYLFPHTAKEHYLANRDKTVGSFINGEFDHWQRQGVSLYAWLRVLWNPEFNVDAAIDEYCHRMFGKAAGTMRTLVGMQIDGWEKSRWPSGVFSASAIYETSYPRKGVQRMEVLLAQAFKEASGDELTTKRLEYVAGPLRKFFAESKDYAEGTGTQTLEVIQVPEEPVIDGKLDDKCWAAIKPVMMISALDAKNPKPKFPTEVKAVWTRRGVTYAFRATEPEPEKMARDIKADSRDASLLWWNENVEIFLDVTGKRSGYYQFIVNCNGAIFDSKGKDASWTAKGMRVATFIGKDFWSAEVYIPYDAFDPVPRPNTGTVWFGNFTRHRVGDRTNREMQRLSSTFSPVSNNENAFGPIKFIEH